MIGEFKTNAQVWADAALYLFIGAGAGALCAIICLNQGA